MSRLFFFLSYFSSSYRTLFFVVHSGPAPVESARLLDRLSLFPVVFALPLEVQRQLGEAHGEACVTVMAAADALLKAQSFEVRVPP
jgi:hypothetical protein